MEAPASSTRQQRQSRLNRLSALLLSNPIIRRWWDNHPASTSTSSPSNEKQQQTTASSSAPSSSQLPQPSQPATPPAAPPPPAPPLPPPPQNAYPPADPDPPIALLLPGMAEITLNNNTATTTPGSGPALSPIHGPLPLYKPDSKTPLPLKVFTPPASSTPDLLLTLPIEVQGLIYEDASLSLKDLVSLRNSCRTLRRDIPIGIMERKLRVQNYAGWDVVFEMHGHRYPGTTYGNRRLCGRCVVPKIRGLLIEGAVVREYLRKRGAEEEEEWPEERGMCFPCLWWVLVKAEGVEMTEESGKEIWKVAGIGTEERFRMLDGTDRKACKKCSRDIHENAVPCPHCTDFGDWCKRSWRYS
ncbi:hypothetical protein B0T14DRAFT_565170 [Immersiella caudata]|uniref:Uncharacterized protein n=1 Tax=Immersiella caudata TaxID=314043 RepID=A0AA39WYA3_9PEZI|nr:hypothetical protein B0T14DRAFT_565170 [Immersiella caudata]